MKQFKEGDLETAIDHNINSLIMEQASDIAEKLTELECQLNDIECYDVEDDETSYTEEAQVIFNIYYDEQVTELYALLNAQLKAIQDTK